jgi:hypothetical protein
MWSLDIRPNVAKEYRNLPPQFKKGIYRRTYRQHANCLCYPTKSDVTNIAVSFVLTSVWWNQVYHRPSNRSAEGWRVGRWEMGTPLPLTRADRSDRRPWKCAQKPGISENLWHSFLYPSKLKLNLKMELIFIFVWRKFAWGYSGNMWICMYVWYFVDRVSLFITITQPT